MSVNISPPRTKSDQVGIKDVIEHYTTETDWSRYKQKHGTLIGPSPIGNEGESKHEPAFFKASPSLQRWFSFGLNCGGNIVELVAAIEDIDRQKAVGKIQNLFELQYPNRGNGRNRQTTSGSGPERDPHHVRLRRIGLIEEAVEHYDAGYCTDPESDMQDRLVCPIYEMDGQISGYVGRKLPGDAGPLYRFRFDTKSGTKFSDSIDEFSRQCGLFGTKRAIESSMYRSVGRVIVVIDLLDVFRFYQDGRNDVAALLNSHVVGRQREEAVFLTPFDSLY
jgi:hypothetical protein